MDHQTYICYHGDQYSFLPHILPVNKVIPPLDQRPTIKAQSRHDVRDLTFVDSHENLVMNRMFNVRGSAPYSLYANAVDKESILRTLNEPLNDCADLRYKPSMNSSLFKPNTVPSNHTEIQYHEINSPASCVIKHQSPETIKEQYQLDKNRLRFHNHTRSAKYQ
jgi:hypothetical protein